MTGLLRLRNNMRIHPLTLRGYPLAGMQWCTNRDGGTVLADDMGLGSFACPASGGAHAAAGGAGFGRTHEPPRLLAGLVRQAGGPVAGDTRQELDERCELIEAHADDRIGTIR
jgi:hypothetical protein